MKKWGIWLFIAFIFLAGIYAVMQSDIGKNLVRNFLTRALQQSGFEVTIGQIEGTLPHQIDLKTVTIQGHGLDVAIAELKLRPVLWRLLKQEIAFTDIHAKGISINQGAPLDFDGTFRIHAKRAVLKGKISDWTLSARLDRARHLVRFTARHPLLNAKGNASLDPSYQLIAAYVQVGSDQIFSKLPFSASGRLFAYATVTEKEHSYKAQIVWQIPNLTIEGARIGMIQGEGEATWQDRTFQGTLTAKPLAKAIFNLEIQPDFRLVGTTEVDIENLQSLHLPDIYGKFHARAIWHLIDEAQGLHFDAIATDFYYGTFFAKKASLYSDLQDPFHSPTGLFDLEVEKAKWRSLELETASLETTSGAESWPFRLFAEGNWTHPLEVHMEGTCQDRWMVDIASFTGTFYNHPFELANPVRLKWTHDLFQLPDVEIAIADATVSLNIDRRADDTHAELRLNQLPLDFLSLNPLDVSVTGTLNLEADVRETNNRLQGDLKAAIEDMQVAQMQAAGRFEGHFSRDLLQLNGQLFVNETPLFQIDISLPIHFSIWPFEATLLMHKKAKGQMDMHGRIEEILDFFDLGPHRIEGECNGQLRFSNTLSRPLVEGSIHFQDGSYQNYYTGTHLNHIAAEWFAEKNVFYLRSLTAQDSLQTGALSANGEIHLVQSDQYPFRMDLTFQNLQFAEVDLVHASANGKIHIEGNALAALAKGDVQILQSELTIPDHIPRPLPHLEVVYRNPIHPIPPPQIAYRPYPLSLDLSITAPNAIAISGRGLNSEWKGNFHIGGTYTAIAAQGNLELISGVFQFSSREFKLIEGSLSFSGVEHEMPHLNIAGSMETKGITIIARLQGPLDDPQLTLQSTPPLPLGSIMSYLLFGQDLSEISGFQALQLATSLANLAGTGPDIMENTRRSLGIDRLRVISDPTEEGGETVALQVGKYISKGVLVSFTQGTEESSTNISVEVELKGNFVFQVESDQHQEQGKFTLKWNLNY